MLQKLQKKRNQKGFTLVELIVVLVILAVLAAIAIPSMLKYVEKSKYAKGEAGIHSIRTAISASLVDAASQDIISQLKTIQGSGTIQTEQPIALIHKGVPSTNVRFKKFTTLLFEGMEKRLEDNVDLADFDIYVSITKEYQLQSVFIAYYTAPADRNKNACYVYGSHEKLLGGSGIHHDVKPDLIDIIMDI